MARKVLAFFVERVLKELSVFIDESGDFGEYSPHSPYYIITMVFHDQEVDIQENVLRLDTELSYLGLENLCIHTGPIIRKEEIFGPISPGWAAQYRKIQLPTIGIKERNQYFPDLPIS